VISAPLPNLDTLDIEALKALVIAQHESSHQQIEHLKLVIEKYRRMIFGSKSEKLKGQLEQLEFQLEDRAGRKRSGTATFFSDDNQVSASCSAQAFARRSSA
jgi:hypothetical protein